MVCKLLEILDTIKIYPSRKLYALWTLSIATINDAIRIGTFFAFLIE